MSRRRRKNKQQQRQWYKADLHIHTPASEDFQEENVNYLQILQEAERKKLDILAFTDHNSVAGFRQIEDELEKLELLERLGRLKPDEHQHLQEYRRLLDKILLVRGFEFTATFGFHIIGLFPPDARLRDLEFLLLNMNVPPEKLDKGATDVGATTDVLTAYELIDEAGGIVIAAHANSSHGVALQGIRFGGQTRIAFTQDPHLHALEVTDLEKKGRRTTARFFDGSKPEYPRKMRCIQASDAHRRVGDPNNNKNQGIGERAIEVLLDDKSFAALREVFTGNDFARTRPYRAEATPYDYIQSAREEGPSIVQEFHERYSRRGGYQDAIVADICAFANTNGGTLYVGVPADHKAPPTGVGAAPTHVVSRFQELIEERITPDLKCAIDVQETQNVKVVRIIVPRGDAPPYAMDENDIYIRAESETTIAVRDEIVELVKRGASLKQQQFVPTGEAAQPAPHTHKPVEPLTEPEVTSPPSTGVEIANTEMRNKTRHYTMRDLRNGNLVNNVTRRSARRLWRYAIEQAEGNPVKENKVQWMGDIGIWNRRNTGRQMRYDLVQRENGKLRVYYGVTEDGLHGKWSVLVEE